MDQSLRRGALAAFCLLKLGAAFLIQPDFDKEKFLGVWYTTGVAMDEQATTSQQTYRVSIESGVESGLILRSQMPEHECRETTVILKFAGKPGKYKTVSADAPSAITVVSTDYISYAITSVENLDIKILNLYTRAEEASEDIQAKFKEVAKCAKFPDSQVMFLQHTEQC